jgi:hypothetical protein
MITDLVLRWVASVVFGATVVSSAACLLGATDWRPAVQHTLHLAMGVAMVAMAWGGGPSPLQQGVFLTLAAGWFAASGPRGADAATGERQGGRMIAGQHAAMMLTMGWMAARMGGLRPIRPASPAPRRCCGGC